jgi:hypothetical protein
MFEIIPSAMEQCIFNDTANGFKRGGYPLSEFIQGEHKMIGGSKHDNDVGISRFDNLAIPVGLLSYSNKNREQLMQTGGSRNNKKEVVGDVINEDIFNKLFFNMASIKSSNSKTRKNHVKK